MFSPPEMTMSMERSLISIGPSSSMTPRSPVVRGRCRKSLQFRARRSFISSIPLESKDWHGSCLSPRIWGKSTMKRQSLWILAAFAGVVLSGGVAWAGPVATSVPEPTSLSLFAAAIGVAAVAKFRRRK
ncbi:MAG: PEP-CTERM sorting domain-containing protein [Rhizomicrobium sp.]